MKTLKTLTTAFLIILSLGAFASEENRKYQMDYTIQTYIDAVAHGKIKGLSEVMDQDVKFTMARGKKIYNYGKSDILKFIKNFENIEQNCITTSSILEQSHSQTIVKVTMQYKNFSNIAYLNIANTTRGWKITNITSTFI